MDQEDKKYLAHTLNSIAGGLFFMFMAGFVISSGPEMFQWIALAGSVVFKISGSFVKAWFDLGASLSLTKDK